MKRIDFEILCGKYLIEPSLAIENEKIKEALKNRNDEEIEILLKNEF